MIYLVGEGSGSSSSSSSRSRSCAELDLKISLFRCRHLDGMFDRR